MNEQIATLKSWVDQSDNIVFFGGAGVSTESGIPDFRLVTTVCTTRNTTIRPRLSCHIHFSWRRPRSFTASIAIKCCVWTHSPTPLTGNSPNGNSRANCVRSLPRTLTDCTRKQVVRRFWSCTSSVHRNYCMPLPLAVRRGGDRQGIGVPRCTCGGIIKPDVVLYEVSLDEYTLDKSLAYIQNADILIIGGTSLAVYPATSLIHYYRGKKLVLVNKTPTSADAKANLVIHGAIGEIFSQL